jgi:hypothetical protein
MPSTKEFEAIVDISSMKRCIYTGGIADPATIAQQESSHARVKYTFMEGVQR